MLRALLLQFSTLGYLLLAGVTASPRLHAQTNGAKGSYPLAADILRQAERFYDVVVAGGSAGGFAAALQARRMGVSVAILAETNAVGGQLLTVPTIDEGWMSRNFPSGIYGELIGRLNLLYTAKGISISGCYWDAGSRCYEPHLVGLQLAAMLRDAGVDVFTRASFKNVVMDGSIVRGVEFRDSTSTSRIFGSKVLIDATEYGDVIPLTGAAHYVGNGTGDSPGVCIQNITYAVPIKFYDVVPARLRLPSPPPGYDAYKLEFQTTVTQQTGSPFTMYPVSLFDHNIYRAMPDLSRGLAANAPKVGPFKSSINLANDYRDHYTYTKQQMPSQYFHLALSGQFLSDPDTRAAEISQAKLKTLAFLYYIQDPKGLNDPHWAIADDEYSDITTVDDYSNDVPQPYKMFEALMPPIPYVRESRRIKAVSMLTADGIRRTLGADGRWRGPVAPAGIAFGDYTTDFHNCNWDGTFESWANESSNDLTMPQGPFQVPFGSFIPETVDGFLVAEKNLGYSRVASSALRLQPSVLSTGQAAGSVAAFAVRNHVQPRLVTPLQVQVELAHDGARISLFAHDDVTPGSPYWADVQVAAARGIMTGTSVTHFSAANPITRREAAVVLAGTLGYSPLGAPPAAPPAATFADVPLADWGLPFVEAIAAHGITSGCSQNPRKFCPDDPMSRQQFAVFLAIGAGLPLGPPGGTGVFSDVDKGFEPYVEAVVRAGLMDPCSTGHFCGATPARRAADVAHGVVRTLQFTGAR